MFKCTVFCTLFTMLDVMWTPLNYILSAYHVSSKFIFRGRCCYRWSWFEPRSEICSAERQANYIRKNKVQFRTPSKRIPLSIEHIGTMWGCRLQGDWYYVYDCVCHAEGCSLLLTKGCDRIAALNPCKQKHPLKLSAHINRTAVYAWSGRWPKS